MTLFKLTTLDENPFDSPFEGGSGLSLFRSDRPPLLIQLSMSHNFLLDTGETENCIGSGLSAPEGRNESSPGQGSEATAALGLGPIH